MAFFLAGKLKTGPRPIHEPYLGVKNGARRVLALFRFSSARRPHFSRVPDVDRLHPRAVEPPKLPVIGTKANIELKTSAYSGQLDKIRAKAEQRNIEREEAGEMDIISKMQSTSAPNIDNSLKGFKIEMYFEYQDEFGNDLFNIGIMV
jgi:hypothetical protein